MTAPATSSYRLETCWRPPEDGKDSVYQLTLRSFSAAATENFRLCICGPIRIDAGAVIDNGSVAVRLSNHTQIEPPPGFTLAAGASWTVTIRALKDSMYHWTQGTTAAYLSFPDGSTAAVDVAPTRHARDGRPLETGAMVFPVADVFPLQLSVIPWPHDVRVSDYRSAPDGLHIVPVTAEQRKAARAFSALTDRLFPAEALISPGEHGALPVHLRHEQDQPVEGYSIVFGPEQAVISASTATGYVYGLITLMQMLRGTRLHPQTFRFPASGEIVDRPLLGWRGIMLDTARQFYSVGEIESFLDTMAWNKLNRFHWHFSDDEAWRLEIEAYPELTRIGAWRGHGLPVPSLLGSGPSPYGGVYSKSEARKIISRADQLGIEVIPEFDVPGHCYAVLQALPWLCDPGETGVYHSIQAFPNNCLNPAREETYRFIETVFGEIADLFPSRHVHVGADEVPADAWQGSPQAQAMLERLGGGGAARLQSEFLRRLQAFLTGRGKIMGAWEEAAHGGGVDRDQCYLNGWHSIGISAQLAEAGYDVVICPGQVCYFDMAQGPDWPEPGSSWAGWSSLETLYTFDFLAGWTSQQKQHCLGLQANIWSESMNDRRVFERLVYPRMSALAEAAWTDADRKSLSRFRGQVSLMPIMRGTPMPDFQEHR